MHSKAIQYKHTPYSAVLKISGKGRQRNMRVQEGFPRFHVVRGRKTLRAYGLPV